MSPSVAFIANLGASVFPFTHRHLGLPRGIIAGPFQLKIAVLIAHHPVIGNTSLGLQAEHLLQFARCRWLAVIVLRLGRLARKPCVVLGQIFFLQETIPRFVRADLLTSHLLDQAILVRAIAALHAPLGLRRVRRDDPDIQLPAHASKLRHWHLAVQLLFFGGLAHIHVFPICVERQRHAVLFDPLPQHPRRRPDRFLLAQAAFYRRGRVVHHVHQASLSGPDLIPVMETAVHLHQLAKVRAPIAPLAMLLALACLAPQTLRQHPPPQRFRVNLQLIFARQVLCRQRRPEAAVLFLYFLQNLLPLFGGPRSVGPSPCIPMLEPRYSPRLVALPQPLGLPVAHPHQHRAIRKPKSPRLHPRQHSASLQLSLTQCCPPHSTSFGGHRKGTLLSRSQGDIIKVAQQADICQYSDKTDICQLSRHSTASPRSAKGGWPLDVTGCPRAVQYRLSIIMVKDATLYRDRNCVSAIRRPEFAEDMLQMHPNGSARITQRSSDFFVAKTFPDEFEDLDFSLGEGGLWQVFAESL